MKDFVVLCSLALVLVLPSPSFAQGSGGGDDTLSNAESSQPIPSLTKLIHLLEEGRDLERRAAELQKLEIAVTYLSFRHRRIESKERELRDLRLGRERLEEIVAKIEADPESWNRLERSSTGNGAPSSAFQEDPADFRLQLFKERLENVDRRIIALETEVNILLGELAELEDYVQRNLDLVQ